MMRILPPMPKRLAMYTATDLICILIASGGVLKTIRTTLKEKGREHRKKI